MSAFSLISSRRFGAVFACITLGAFNDNFYKNALIILLTYQLSASVGIETPVLISIASAFFILPFFLFSGFAGELADATEKHLLIRRLKVIEAALMVVAAIALPLEQVWVLLGVLFLLGVLAAFFGPTKYAILPQLLKTEELLLGNGLVEGGTFLTILLGTLVGGLLILQPNGITVVSASLVLMGLLGVWAAWRVPVTAIANPGMRINYNVFQSTWRMVRHAAENPKLLAPILGISWFWAVGATYLVQLPVFTKEVLGANETVVTLFNGVFTIGVALGSFLCPYLIERFHPRNLSSIALFGVLLFGLDFCWVGYGIAPPEEGALSGLIAYLDASLQHVRITVDLFLIAFSGGLFIVPLYTSLQTQGVESERARTIASNNVINALFIASASLLASILFAQGVTVLQVVLLFSLLNAPMLYVLRRVGQG